MAKKRVAGKPNRGIYLVRLILLLSLFTLIVFAGSAALADVVKWTRVNIPTEGAAGNWVLADGSDIRHLTMADDGTLFAYGQGLTYTLYKSTDGGRSWSRVGNVQDSIVGIAIAPGNTDYIYYATTSAVYRSANGGKNFSLLPASPGGAGSNNVEITSIDVARLTSNIIAVGTRDTDTSQFGGIYTLDEREVISSWADISPGSYDVYAVAFSPNYAAARQLVAVVTDETDTFVTTKIGDGGWGANIDDATLDKDNSGTPTPVVVAESAAIAFPDDYDADGESEDYVQFIAIDTGSSDGDVYKIKGANSPGNSTATDLNIGSAYGSNNIDVTGLAVGGSAAAANLLAGAADSPQTYFSSDAGTSWSRSRKEPTGGSDTYVLMALDFAGSRQLYAATTGSQSAFSISRDNGATWNQASLIDTAISTIVDLAPSPAYSRDNTLFMLTYGGEHSLWRSLDSGTTWARIFASSLANVDSFNMVELPPQYGAVSQVVFVAGESNSRPAIWKSTDNGQKFTRQLAIDPTSGATLSIDAWAVVDDETLFIGSYNGTNSLVYRTANSGFFYSAGVAAGANSLNSAVLSPNYSQDRTILAGNTNGWVYWSDDDGASFEPLPTDAASAPLTGAITVSFDSNFGSNKTVYAAGDTADEGVYRFKIGTSAEWESIDSTLPSGGTINQITVSTDGALYAANSNGDDGMERSLNPAYSLGPTFETVTRGLNDSATLSGLWIHGNTLWSIDIANNKLMTFIDSLTSPTTQYSPANTTSGTGIPINHTINNVILDWEALSGTTSYKWQLDHDTDFSSVPSGFEANTKATSVRLPTLEPATKYYWRVRAASPVLSPWSDKWTFTTSLDTEAVALNLESPKAGASGVPAKPLFQWSGVAGADAYELLIATDANFSNPSVSKMDTYALPTTAWQSNVSLNHDTTYYWQVRAINGDTRSAWSAVGAFTTEPPPSISATEIAAAPSQTPAAPSTLSPAPAPVPPTPPPPVPAYSATPALPPAPASVQLPGTPGWVVYLVGAMFLTIILLLIIVMMLVTGIRRP